MFKDVFVVLWSALILLSAFSVALFLISYGYIGLNIAALVLFGLSCIVVFVFLEKLFDVTSH